ncbi:hypothetical protein E3N88_19711 [Mikania micrantha]|uniref:Uncharacterized protein n=1 Tax=Mikania micrantha TaxID=192012 RepID=A0A5N6NRE8_9ASTR|nr:hypothetical protein E3N88_19711 [Mikania micrantha]
MHDVIIFALRQRRRSVSKSMENLKKNRSEMRDDDRISGKKLRSRMEGSNGGATAEDAELEEFLAILTRLKAGLNRFKAKGAGKSAVVTPPVMDSGFRDPGFELDDFNQCEDDGQKTSFRDTSPDDRAVIGFDLNADPVSDQKSD